MLIIHHEINNVSVALVEHENLMGTITLVRSTVIVYKTFFTIHHLTQRLLLGFYHF